MTYDLHPEDIAKANTTSLPKAEPKKDLDVRAIQLTVDNFKTICDFLNTLDGVLSYSGKFFWTGGDDEHTNISLEVKLRDRGTPLYFSDHDYLVVNDVTKLSCMKRYAFEKIYDL